MKQLCASFITFAFTAVPSFAQLTFDSYIIEKEVNPLRNDFDFNFSFKNLSNNEVIITDIDVSCSCVSAFANRSKLKSMDSGNITGKVNVAGNAGAESQCVILFMKYGTCEEKAVLTINYTIPNMVYIKPSLLLWQINEPCEPKASRISIDTSYITEITDIICNSDDFVIYRDKDVKDTTSYILKVAPISTSKRKKALIQIKVKTIEGTLKTYYVNTMIK